MPSYSPLCPMDQWTNRPKVHTLVEEFCFVSFSWSTCDWVICIGLHILSCHENHKVSTGDGLWPALWVKWQGHLSITELQCRILAAVGFCRDNRKRKLWTAYGTRSGSRWPPFQVTNGYHLRKLGPKQNSSLTQSAPKNFQAIACLFALSVVQPRLIITQSLFCA